jgi:hypothetical protein
LMESVSSCIFFSQVLGCLINNSLVFLLITISSRVLSFCFLFVLFCWIGLPFCFAILFHSFFWVFHILACFPFIVSELILRFYVSSHVHPLKSWLWLSECSASDWTKSPSNVKTSKSPMVVEGCGVCVWAYFRCICTFQVCLPFTSCLHLS